MIADQQIKLNASNTSNVEHDIYLLLFLLTLHQKIFKGVLMKNIKSATFADSHTSQYCGQIKKGDKKAALQTKV